MGWNTRDVLGRTESVVVLTVLEDGRKGLYIVSSDTPLVFVTYG
jgi:hypothetical protein